MYLCNSKHNKYSRILTSIQEEQAGQAIIELAALIPVVIIAALILLNLGFYLERCAKFDRVASDAVAIWGVSPDGEQDNAHALEMVKDAIESTFSDANIEIDVHLEHMDLDRDGFFALSPSRLRYICQLIYHPYPTSFSIAGVSLDTPLSLIHKQTLVIDTGAAGLG